MGGARTHLAGALIAPLGVLALVVPPVSGAVAAGAGTPAGAAGLAGTATHASDVPAEPVPACGSEDAPSADRSPSRRRSGSTLSVATYNVLFARGTSNESLDARVPLLVDAIHGAGVDVVGLQEVEELGSRGFTTARLAAGLADMSGLAWHWCFFAANPALPGEPDTLVGGGGPGSLAIQPLAALPLDETTYRTGIGLLSRYPIVESGAHRLGLREPDEVAACPDLECELQAGFESRASVRGVVATPRGRVQVVSTHLAHTLTSRSDVTRLAQAGRLLEWLDAVPASARYPTVLTGDFNAVEGSAVHDAVLAGGFVDTFRRATSGDPGYTSPQDIAAESATVGRRIDYVFARNSQCTSAHRPGDGPVVRVVGSEVFGNAPSTIDDGVLWPSDHYGVATELRLLPTTPGTCTAPARSAL